MEEGSDWIRIHPISQWQAPSIHTYDDHRVAMCFSLAAFNPAGLPVRIEDPKCVAKTFPDYFEALFSLSHAEQVPVICIDGPTASGKSALALEYARKLDGEIVNADAFQLYRGLEIVSAAPSPQERELMPHHLYGVLSPQESANAGSYMRLAEPVIGKIKSRGKTPIITGGSGLYLKFLTHGPAPLPSGDEKLRAELDTRTLEDLVAQLRALDPLEASRTDLQNRRYVERALEVCLITGEKISKLRDQWEQKTREVSQHLRGIVIHRSRADLHQRIAARTRAMLEGGAIEEVAALLRSSVQILFLLEYWFLPLR